MKFLTRPLIAVVAITAGAIFLSAAIVAASVLVAPPVGVSVHIKQEGIKFWVPVPSLWLETGAALVPFDDLGLDDMPEEARQAIRAASGMMDELGRIDDAQLVEVETGEETVKISKRGKLLHVEVRSADADVDIDVPISTLEALLQRVAT